jgi:hypothetical protein
MAGDVPDIQRLWDTAAGLEAERNEWKWKCEGALDDLKQSVERSKNWHMLYVEERNRGIEARNALRNDLEDSERAARVALDEVRTVRDAWAMSEKACQYNSGCLAQALADLDIALEAMKEMRAELDKVTRQRDQAQELIKSYVNSNTRRETTVEPFDLTLPDGTVKHIKGGPIVREEIARSPTPLDNWQCRECGTANGWTSLWCCLCGHYKDEHGGQRYFKDG